jgi:hypothetical protein
MDMAFRCGPTEPSIGVTGRKTELMARGAFGTQTEISLKESSKTTNLTERGHTRARTVLFIKGCGLMMSSMAKDKQCGLMDQLLLEIMWKGRSTELVATNGLKVISFKASGKTI